MSIDAQLLIPQKPPMVMVDDHISSDANKTVSSLFIKENNIFCKNGVFTEPGLIENMAQTAALRTGYLFSQQAPMDDTEFQKPPIGFIGGIKKLTVHSLPEIGKNVSTTIEIEAEIMNALVAKGTIMCEGKLVAEGEIKIFLENKQN